MERVISYTIVLAIFPGRAKAAANFVQRMQTDPNSNPDFQLLNSIPVTKTEIDMRAKTPDASMLCIEALADEKQSYQDNKRYKTNLLLHSSLMML